MHNRVNVNLKGDRCWYPAAGKNTLRFGMYWQGPGTNAGWVVTVYARITPDGEPVSLGITYSFSANGTSSGPHVIPACSEVYFVVTTTESSGSGTQTPCWVRVEALLTAE